MAATEHKNRSTEKIEVGNLAEMHDRLDTLWIAYLKHLDVYATSQKLLQKHMSAGFLSLARANFNARNGVRRYGQDYYHDRAVATRRAKVSVDREDGKATVDIMLWREPVIEESNEGGAEEEAAAAEGDGVKQQPSPPTTPKPEDSSSSDANALSTDPAAGSTSTKRSRLEADPIRWFGILSPPTLRSAQASFSSAVDEAVAEAVNAARAMREYEVEIRKLRKEIRRVEKAGGVVKG